MFGMTMTQADVIRQQMVQRVRAIANETGNDIDAGAAIVAQELASDPPALLRAWRALGPEMVARVVRCP